MLEIRDLKAGYGKAVIVDGVSLTVPTGAIVALLGGNGTGKSTTLKAICGLIDPMDGDVLLNGESLVRLGAPGVVKRGLCLVPQGKEAFAEMTVRENLLMGAYMHRANRGEVASRLEEVVTRFPRLAELATRRAGHLSGGERQLMALGRALMAKPRALLLDEPSAALSPRVVGEIGEAVMSLKEAGMTVLLVEQNVNFALKLAERLYVLRDGRIALERAVVGGDAGTDLKSYYFGVEE
ncbi:ABC transporter ATP-binding protein [Bosea sp. (in: a-proteobacteria)]|uniref:ABC transporter ATP-binding protein n=1 Tax=Bosea sp. (in: a-proteobacteria) TaxID=1871050 RepID=UPI00260D4314|nr:ABC transporter ATP-binding protein [Bosea sp. (in: a-proteobacteria)]MCO5093151.1 ABC transporter ATP-binding protein [Bosea sp. (in: a-proteobacteria)]